MTQYPYFYQPSLNLKLNDIKGTNIGSKNRINKFKGNNYELTTQDIPGCCVGSLKKGIVTKRCTNPLNPDYQFLGAKELAGSKFGEYSKKQRAKSVSNINTMDNNRIKSPQIKEETKNYENVNENNVNNKEAKMVKINDIEKEANLVNNKENVVKNNNFEEDKSESNYNQEIYNNQDTLNFDREKFGKKPDPNYAFLHDPSVQSSENLERLKLIEKEKGIRMAQKTLSMSKTGNGFFNNKKINGNEIAKYQNNPNLTNFVQYQRINANNIRMNYGGKMANNLGGVGHLNIENGMNDMLYENNDVKQMNKTSIGFRPMKKTYEEKLDNFMARNNLKYIEPNKIEEKPKSNGIEKEKDELSVKGNKSLQQKGSNNNSKKVNKK